MKKLLSILLVLCLALALAACGSPSAPAVDISGPDDLTGKTIGVQLGTTGDTYASDIEGATIERYSKGVEAVQALKQGKIDAVIIDDQPAKSFVAGNDDLKVLEEPFTDEDYAICVAKENTQLKDDINAALKELEADGVLQQLKDYYINGVEGAQPYTSPADADHSKGTLIMATNAEFPPYEYHDSMEAIVGFDVDLATAICDKLGYSLQIEDMAFDSIIAAVQTGKADFGAAGMTVNEERLKSVDFTDPICHATQVIIIRK